MRFENSPVEAVSADQKHWHSWGGVTAIVLAIGYVVIIPLYAHVGAPPNGAEAWFNYLPGKTAIWWWILGISVFTDLLYIPLALALYVALKAANKYLMVLAAIFMTMFVVLDLAITWAHYASILTLYQNYAATADGAHRAAYVAAAECASAVLATRMEIVYAIVTPSIGVLLAGIVMLKSQFGKLAAVLALITGILGILSLTGYYPVIIGNALFATVWFLVVGFRFIQLARKASGRVLA